MGFHLDALLSGNHHLVVYLFDRYGSFSTEKYGARNTVQCCHCHSVIRSPEAPCALGRVLDPCLLVCNASRCNALRREKSNGGASREDEEDAAAEARTGPARIASRG